MKSNTRPLLTLILLSNRPLQSISTVHFYLSYCYQIIVPSASLEYYNLLSEEFSDHALVSVLDPCSVPDNIDKSISFSNINSRFFTAEKYLTTDYFLIISDDDLHLRSGLQSAVEFLQDHPECANFFGSAYCMYFTPLGLPLIGSIYEPPPNFSTDTPMLTATYTSCKYYPLIYGVSRRSVLSNYVQLSHGHSPWAGSLEFVYALSVALLGSSYYSSQTDFLIRLSHKPSRSISEDYFTSLNTEYSISQIVGEHIKVFALQELLKSSINNMPYAEVILDFFDDIYKHYLTGLSLLSSKPRSVVKYNHLRSLIGTSGRATREIILSSSRLNSLYRLYHHSFKYYQHKSRFGIEVRYIHT